MFLKHFSTKCLKTHGKCIHFKRFLHVFCTHKNQFFFNNYFQTFFPESVSKHMKKSFISKRFLHVFCSNLLKTKLLKKKKPFLHVFFFKLVSTKCLKTHAKCIYFKTVFASVLHAFTKLKIAHKNAVFSTFFQNLSRQSVSKSMQNATISKWLLPVFCKHLPK